MNFFDQAKSWATSWLQSLDAQDHMILLAVGLILILCSVAALILQGIFSRRANKDVARTSYEAKKTPIWGERHMVDKSSQKGDPFLRRINQLT